MEEQMKIKEIPQIDSIEELARFWDTHDLTDFEDQLEEVIEPIFIGETESVIKIHLQPAELDAVEQIAKSKGLKQAALIREWILEKLHHV